MGSEHYCLRWNNHQSNLLGVFSQLLQDESLVDVTLACSEGTSIRAHKVVLSACSSYFQTLFLDHPARHPIVILKDVRFAELRTLIEFMYKGEVNVEYCQLSALLKTAESLKVKGLAEMTNQSSVLRDSDREPERLRTTHSHTTSSSTSSSLTSTAAAAAAAAAAIGITTKTFESLSELSSITKNRCLETETCSPSPTRLQSSPTPLALYQRKNNRDHTHSSSVSSLAEQQLSNNSNNNNNNSVNSSSNNNINMNNNNNNNNNNDDCNMNADERHSNNNNSEDEDDNDVKMKNEMGLNMIIAPNSQNSTIINSTSLITDLRPSSRGGLGERERGSPRSQRDRNERTLGSGGIPSPLSEPIPGPSGMGPVQQVPLSLKKEIDWDRSEDKSSGDSSLDFRHPHDSNGDRMMLGHNFNRATKTSTPSNMMGFPGVNNNVGAIPFVFPFAPLGLGLFDADPSRILNLLHHQSILAEEAMRYRNMFLNSKEMARHNPFSDMIKSEIPTSPQHPFKDNRNSIYPNDMSLNVNKNNNLQEVNKVEVLRVKEGLVKETVTKSILDELLFRKSEEEKNQKNPEDLSAYSTLMKSRTDFEHINEVGNETKCHICMANFPSTWLLEQHSALQHPHLSIHDDKPYSCDLCGQQSRYNCCRYRSALSKHRDQNNRARIPADKLFTCDVCGMQFRYLKSFKKHRLNHALERLHGKKDRAGESSELVSSTNENEGVDLRGIIKDDENMSDVEDQDDTVDSLNNHLPNDNQHNSNQEESQPKISSSVMEMNNEMDFKKYQQVQRNEPESTMPSTSSLNATLNTLINAETIPSQHLLGLNPQEASILNFLRVDAAEKQRDRRFACPFCGKCVRSKENLKLHVRKHTGERPFVCLFCGRAFGGKSDLTRHLRIHTGERPYHCEACGKCFARADYLSKHLTTHVHNTPR